MSTADTDLVWRVEPADSWPAGDLLGDIADVLSGTEEGR
jgi:hypothetical protein